MTISMVAINYLRATLVYLLTFLVLNFGSTMAIGASSSAGHSFRGHGKGSHKGTSHSSRHRGGSRGTGGHRSISRGRSRSRVIHHRSQRRTHQGFVPSSSRFGHHSKGGHHNAVSKFHRGSIRKGHSVQGHHKIVQGNRESVHGHNRHHGQGHHKGHGNHHKRHHSYGFYGFYYGGYYPGYAYRYPYDYAYAYPYYYGYSLAYPAYSYVVDTPTYSPVYGNRTLTNETATVEMQDDHLEDTQFPDGTAVRSPLLSSEEPPEALPQENKEEPRTESSEPSDRQRDVPEAIDTAG